MLLVKEPVPLPSDVLLFETVGFSEVFQQTPLAVTSAPPSAVTLPPEVAVVRVTADTAAVVSVGGTGSFLQELSQRTDPAKSKVITKILRSAFMILVLVEIQTQSQIQFIQ
jgi:hypothetical protein